MVNPTLNINTVFRENVDKCFKYTFNSSTMSGMINVMKKKTCVIAPVIFYESRETNPMKVFRVLSCVLYYVIENYVCIEYLCCQFKTISVICYDKIFTNMSYNE